MQPLPQEIRVSLRGNLALCGGLISLHWKKLVNVRRLFSGIPSLTIIDPNILAIHLRITWVPVPKH